MKLDKNKNTYTIIYSSIVVVIVALLLSGASILLKDPQQKNIVTAKRLDILHSIGKGTDVKKHEQAEEEYNTYIKESYTVNYKGEKTNADAFNIDLKAESNKPIDQQNFPVFIANINNQIKYILPVRGAGLWGPVWGYIALNDDAVRIYGTVFDHKGETPGLGAEISTPIFQKQFVNKAIREGDKFTGIKVIKPGSAPLDVHSVDGISGGTITSKAVEDMIYKGLNVYDAYFKTQIKRPVIIDTISVDSLQIDIKQQ